MSIVIITIRDTEGGVDISQTDVSDIGEVNTPAVMLGGAMYRNALKYLERHPGYGQHTTESALMH